MQKGFREINLELGHPTVKQAMQRLQQEIPHSRKDLDCAVLKVIHGYGSSGSGGKIRLQCRSYLQQLKQQRQIKDFIPGEKFSIFEEQTRQAFRLCDALRRDEDLDRYNNGVTYIIL